MYTVLCTQLHKTLKSRRSHAPQTRWSLKKIQTVSRYTTSESALPKNMGWLIYLAERYIFMYTYSTCICTYIYQNIYLLYIYIYTYLKKKKWNFDQNQWVGPLKFTPSRESVHVLLTTTLMYIMDLYSILRKRQLIPLLLNLMNKTFVHRNFGRLLLWRISVECYDRKFR